MSVVAESCPNCGAPLTIVDGRCAFCHQPLARQTTPAAPAVPADVSFLMTVDQATVDADRRTVVTGRIAVGRLTKGAALVVETPVGPRTVTCTGIVIDGDWHLFADAGTTVDAHLDGDVYPKDIPRATAITGATDR